MLKDITESKRSDTHILGTNDRLVSGYPVFHTKILSRLFWSAMRDDVFNVPLKIYELQRRDERAFESLKKKRKLTRIQTAGTVEVEPELDGCRAPHVVGGGSTDLAVVERTSGPTRQERPVVVER